MCEVSGQIVDLSGQGLQGVLVSLPDGRREDDLFIFTDQYGLYYANWCYAVDFDNKVKLLLQKQGYKSGHLKVRPEAALIVMLKHGEYILYFFPSVRFEGDCCSYDNCCLSKP